MFWRIESEYAVSLDIMVMAAVCCQRMGMNALALTNQTLSVDEVAKNSTVHLIHFCRDDILL